MFEGNGILLEAEVSSGGANPSKYDISEFHIDNPSRLKCMTYEEFCKTDYWNLALFFIPGGFRNIFLESESFRKMSGIEGFAQIIDNTQRVVLEALLESGTQNRDYALMREDVRKALWDIHKAAVEIDVDLFN